MVTYARSLAIALLRSRVPREPNEMSLDELARSLSVFRWGQIVQVGANAIMSAEYLNGEIYEGTND